MLEVGNYFDRLMVSIKSNLKISTLENTIIGPSVVSPPVPTFIHIQALVGIDIAYIFSKV